MEKQDSKKYAFFSLETVFSLKHVNRIWIKNDILFL